MAGEKNKVVITVIDGLTNNQAAQITSDIIKSKNKHAPNARGTVASGNREDAGKLLNKGQNRIKLLESKEKKVNGSKTK